MKEATRQSCRLCRDASEGETREEALANVQAAIAVYREPIEDDRDIEAQFARAYAGDASSLLDEVEVLMDQQLWPND